MYRYIFSSVEKESGGKEGDRERAEEEHGVSVFVAPSARQPQARGASPLPLGRVHRDEDDIFFTLFVIFIVVSELDELLAAVLVARGRSGEWPQVAGAKLGGGSRTAAAATAADIAAVLLWSRVRVARGDPRHECADFSQLYQRRLGWEADECAHWPEDLAQGAGRAEAHGVLPSRSVQQGPLLRGPIGGEVRTLRLQDLLRFIIFFIFVGMC